MNPNKIKKGIAIIFAIMLVSGSLSAIIRSEIGGSIFVSSLGALGLLDLMQPVPLLRMEVRRGMTTKSSR